MQTQTEAVKYRRQEQEPEVQKYLLCPQFSEVENTLKKFFRNEIFWQFCATMMLLDYKGRGHGPLSVILLSFITVILKGEMSMNIYVGNLSRDLTEAELKETFEAFGTVNSASIIKDRYTGESRGFGFVEMPNQEEAQAAINGLNGKNLKGRTATVNEARPRQDKPRSGFGGGRGRGSSGGRRY